MKKQPPIEARSNPISRNTPETLRYFYHPDHIGSTSWVTDSAKNGIQYCEYLPFGEPLVDQRSTTWNSRYTFSGKERDGETGYSYFGARYYNSDISIWLSVDPLSDKYPNLSPYAYCANNPIILVYPDGREIDDGLVRPPKKSSGNQDYSYRIPTTTSSTKLHNSSSTTSHTTTAETEQNVIPQNPYIGISVNNSNTKGVPDLVNKDTKITKSDVYGEAPTTTSSVQVGIYKLGGSAGVGTNGKNTASAGISVNLLGLLLSVEVEGNTDIINSNVSLSVGATNGVKASSLTIEVKPVTVLLLVLTKKVSFPIKVPPIVP